jgi:hypothetical protein
MLGQDKRCPARVCSRPVNEQPAAPRKDLGALPLAAGMLACAWAVAIMLPDVRDLPAWPAASLGVVALVCARLLPGRALPRGLGAFLGLFGLLIGLAKIFALWGLLHILNS